MCTNLGAETTTKVKAQIEEMATATGIDDETKDLAIQVMLSGHDGAHPHLPEINQERATVLLELLGDLSYQLFTRAGKIRKASELRRDAVAAKTKPAGPAPSAGERT
jgi:hypothetical protein